ncbi:MAG TPA: DNA (cytosine-5-)-methyltransferase [Pyrinomonadaceae bacterium]|nr:DNA (cytosine-5-)-methyltransferase [Pyrinomonadaceae bacterium]
MATRNKKTFAEFFAGIGLMRTGLERAGWSVAFANDIDAQKEEIYQASFPGSYHFRPGDIHGFSPNEIPTVSLATASFPCNDLSLAGGRKGLGGKNSSAFWGFVRLLGRMGQRVPPLLLIENVTGFLTSNEGRDFEDAMLALNDLGYAVDPFVVDAAWFVPQSRRRLFVVGMKVPQSKTFAGEELYEETPLRPNALMQFILSRPDIKWALHRLPSPPTGTQQLKDILEDLPETFEGWWSADRAAYLLNQMSSRHRKIADKMIAGRNWSYGTVFRRIRNAKSMAELRTDGLAGCLRTPRGGSGRQILFKAGKGTYQVRLLTPRECGRLMGVDDFSVDVPLNQALFGFGDAVCVPAIEWIATNYLNPVWKKEYASKAATQGTAKILPYRRAARA